MKKTILALTLMAATAAASANVTAFVKADYANANSGQPLHSQYEVATGAALKTTLGTLDAALLGQRIKTRIEDDGLGFELGYSNGLKLGTVKVTGRVSYGRVNQLRTRVAGFKGNTEFYGIEAEAALPVTKGITAFVAARHRNGIDTDTPAAANRLTVGADIAVTKGITARVGYSHTKQNNVNLNGLTTAVTYAF